MSFLTTRIRRALAKDPDEPMTHSLLVAINAHWRSLADSDPKIRACFGEGLDESTATIQISQKANSDAIAFSLAAWEAKRAAFLLEATLGGPPGTTGPLRSSDWGTHWILFDWDSPKTGALVWGYRVERSSDNRNFYPVDICTEAETTLLDQPPNQKFYYRVVPFNGFGDGPPSPIFGILFDLEVIDRGKKSSNPDINK